MLQILRNWFDRNFSDPQAVYLVVLLLLGFSVVIFAGAMLLPVFASQDLGNFALPTGLLVSISIGKTPEIATLGRCQAVFVRELGDLSGLCGFCQPYRKEIQAGGGLVWVPVQNHK